MARVRRALAPAAACWCITTVAAFTEAPLAAQVQESHALRGAPGPLPPTFDDVSGQQAPPLMAYQQVAAARQALAPAPLRQEQGGFGFADAQQDAATAEADAEAVAAGKALPPEQALPQPVEQQAPPPPTRPPGQDSGGSTGIGGVCNEKTFRESLILWSCDSPRGTATVKAAPGEVLPILKVPTGVKNLKIRLTTSAALQVSNMQGNKVVGKGAPIGAKNPSGSYHGMAVLMQNTGNSEGVFFNGDSKEELIVSVDNSAGRHGVDAMLAVSHDGLNTCPSNPIGCAPFDAAATGDIVRKWACAASHGFPTAKSAWDAIGSRQAVAGRIPWHKFGDVWDMFQTGDAGNKETSWMLAFKHLDKDGDSFISEMEFEAGYRLCAGGQLVNIGALGSIGDRIMNGLCWLVGLVVVGGLLYMTAKTLKKQYDERAVHVGTKGSSPILHGRHHHHDPEAPHEALQKHAAQLEQKQGAGASQRTCGSIFDCAGWRAKVTSDAPAPVPPRPQGHQDGPTERDGLLQDPEAQMQAMEHRQHEAEAEIAARDREIEQLRNAPLEPRPYADEAMGHSAPRGFAEEHEEHGFVRSEEQGYVRDEDAHAALGGVGAPPQDEMGRDVFELQNNPDIRERTQAVRHLSTLMGPEEGKHKACQMRVHETIVQAMRQDMRQHDADHLMVAGCTALRVLCHSITEENELSLEVARVGGIEVVLEAMRNFPDSSNVQEAACRALRHLALHTTNRVRLCRDHGMETIRTTMLHHPRSEGVQESGCLAIGNLAFEAESRQNVNRELLHAIVAGMEEHQHHLVVVEAGVFALYNLICTADCFDLVREVGGVDAVRKAADNHPEMRDSEEAQCIINADADYE